MLKKLRILLLALLAALCCTVTAWADYDYIDRYDVTAAPNADDGSLTITVDLTWTALEELPYGQELKIGVPNGSVRDEEALTDNIERLSFDNSYMYVYLDRAYKQGETFTFSYRWVQEYMYTLSGNTVTFDYTPGWFDEARVGGDDPEVDRPRGPYRRSHRYCGRRRYRRAPDRHDDYHRLRPGLRRDHGRPRRLHRLAHRPVLGQQRR